MNMRQLFLSPCLLGPLLLWTVIAVFFISCKSENLNQLPSEENVYRRDLFVNGIEGIGVLSIENQYQFNIESRDEITLLKLTTCHRSIYAEKSFNINQKQTISWFGFPRKITKPREFEFIYKPTWIEFKDQCPILIQAYSPSGNVSSAFLAIQDNGFQLGGTISCNSITYKQQHGVFACQSYYGTTQVLAFDVEVEVAKNNTCGLSGKAKTWNIEQNLGDCLAVFKDKNNNKAVYYGYSYNKEYIR